MNRGNEHRSKRANKSVCYNQAWLESIAQSARFMREYSTEELWDHPQVRQFWHNSEHKDAEVRETLWYSAQHASKHNWIDQLPPLLEALLNTKVQISHSLEDIPYSANLAPLAEHVIDGIMLDNTKLHNLLRASREVLRRDLIKSLSWLSAQTLQHEFSLFRTLDTPAISNALFGGPIVGGQHKLIEFSEQLSNGGWVRIFERYPILARLIVTLVTQWQNHIHLLLQRLAQDQVEICERFGWNTGTGSNGRDIGQAEKRIPTIERLSLSDRHAQGQSVAEIKFGEFGTVYYKPRSLSIDLAWQQILDLFKTLGSPTDLTAVEVIERDDYGWANGVTPKPCTNRAEINAYYFRAGVLTAILHGLNGLDFHSENLMAVAEHPVLLDLEGLLHPELLDPTRSESSEPASSLMDRLLNSVVSTGLLPTWLLGDLENCMDLSALGDGGGQLGAYEVNTWHDINTDAMVLRQARQPLPHHDNEVWLEQSRQNARDFAPDIISGYREMAHFLHSHHREIAAGLAQLPEFQGRFLFRQTGQYARLLGKALQPGQLESGVKFGLCLEGLFDKFRPLQQGSIFNTLVDAEMFALERLDIPLFHHHSADHTLYAGSENKMSYAVEPMLSLVANRLRALNQTEIDYQCSVIAGCIQSSGQMHQSSEKQPLGNNNSSPPAASDRSCINGAIAIGETLISMAHRDANDSYSWMGPCLLPGAKNMQFAALQQDLFSGNLGIALLFAALYHTTDDERWLAAVHNTVATLTQQLEVGASNQELLLQFNQRPLSLASGWAGVAYAMQKLAVMTGDNRYLAAAKRAVNAISPDDINDDDQYDLLLGNAGTILAMLSINTQTSIKLASLGGVHLLNMASAEQADQLFWPTLDGKPQTGLAHGASGLALALDKLGEHNNRYEHDYKQLALSALAFEDQFWIVEKNNWRDLRFHTTIHCTTSWCHGATGIGLARSRIYKNQDTQSQRNCVAAAAASSIAHGAGDTDHACCGLAGRMLQVHDAALFLDDQSLKEIALQMANDLLSRAPDQLRFFPNTEGLPYNPGLFQGAAGIGLSLLQIAQPELPIRFLTVE